MSMDNIGQKQYEPFNKSFGDQFHMGSKSVHSPPDDIYFNQGDLSKQIPKKKRKNKSSARME